MFGRFLHNETEDNDKIMAESDYDLELVVVRSVVVRVSFWVHVSDPAPLHWTLWRLRQVVAGSAAFGEVTAVYDGEIPSLAALVPSACEYPPC